MNIQRNYGGEPTELVDFATRHGLTLELRRNSVGDYLASFANAEVLNVGIVGILSSEYGQGRTEDIAVERYAHWIRGRLLVVDAYRASRREIDVPHNLQHTRSIGDER